MHNKHYIETVLEASQRHNLKNIDVWEKFIDDIFGILVEDLNRLDFEENNYKPFSLEKTKSEVYIFRLNGNILKTSCDTVEILSAIYKERKK